MLNFGFDMDDIDFETVQQMFEKSQTKAISEIRKSQDDLLNRYFNEAYMDKDVALELPTGAGKTLIGLLIGEFRRRKHNEKILYLCPNKQLVNQTVKHAVEDYGINATAFIGRSKEYSNGDTFAYNNAETIAVSTYSSLFNSNPFFKTSDVIIFDDAHSAENYVASNWTVTINHSKDKTLFYNLMDQFKPHLDKYFYEKIVNNDVVDAMNGSDVDLLPNIKLVNEYHMINKTIDEYIAENPDTEIRFAWSMICDNLSACNIFISLEEIVIRPYISPTVAFSPFARAKQRIYMSATLGRSGELERIFGVPKIKKLYDTSGYEKQIMGRRMFLFPQKIVDQKKPQELLLDMISREKRALIIVNKDRTQEELKELIAAKTDKDIFTAKDIEFSSECFTKSENAVLIVANRYDGIDFPGEKCRLEILYDLKWATNIQERFLISRMAAGSLFSQRVHSALVQAFGRCTRTNEDYAGVCIIGGDTDMFSYNKFESELQYEIKAGNSYTKNYASIEKYLDMLDGFLNDKSIQGEYENSIRQVMEKRPITDARKGDDQFDRLSKAGRYEVEVQYDIWKEAYEEALKKIRKICEILQHDNLKGYLGFWYYIAAYCAYNLYFQGDGTFKSVYKEYLDKASSNTKSIKWLKKLRNEDKRSMIDDDDRGIYDVLENMESLISEKKYMSSNTKSFYEELNQLLFNLASAGGKNFEQAHKELGLWLGYYVENPKGDSQPDPIWIANPEWCIVAEDKIYEAPEKAIPTRHVREAAGHPDWVKSEYERLKLWKDINPICVIITNAKQIESSAQPYAGGIYYLNRDTFVEWSKKCIDVLKELIECFSFKGDVVWREKAFRLMKEKKVAPKDFEELIKSYPLKNLPAKNRK